MAKYKLKTSYRGKVTYSDPLASAGEALDRFNVLCKNGVRIKTAVIIRDSEGEDHPSNAGKFFLHRILK